jgi:hypothetical protein
MQTNIGASKRPSFDFVAKSVILRGERPNKPLEAIESKNPNQMNRVIGYLPDGTKCVVAQRPGKGGMDFNKLMGGKVYAVAADGFSPTYEKEKDDAGQPESKVAARERKQKFENGVPLFSASGFYLLSSKEYAGLEMFYARTRLFDNGEKVALITDEQMAAAQVVELADEMDLDLLEMELLGLLDDSENLVAKFDADINRRRERAIRNATEEAQDAGGTYSGVAYKELAVSSKDGNPYVEYAFRTSKGVHAGRVRREVDVADRETGLLRPVYLEPAEAVQRLKDGKEWAELRRALAEGESVSFHFVQGHIMRTSVSFRRKCLNVLEAKQKSPDKPVYGDGVYILGALEHWTRGIATLMHSMHPNFPAADYDAHHYVCAVRQAEVGMNRVGEKNWSPPQAVRLSVAAELLKTKKAEVTV